MREIIKKQTNVKEIDIQESLPGIKLNVKAGYKQLKLDFKDKIPKIIAKLSVDSPQAILGHIEKEGKYKIKIDGEDVDILKEHLIITRDVPDIYQEVEFRKGFIYLNKEMNDELKAEGYSREIMRRVQSLRKKAGLEKKDRIALFLKTDVELHKMLSKFEKQIKEKVGADKIKISELSPGKKNKFNSKEKVRDKKFEIGFDKV